MRNPFRFIGLSRIAENVTGKTPNLETKMENEHQISSGRVLIVDDEPTLLNVLTQALRHAGFQVTTAKIGPTASERLADRAFDTVPGDTQIPDPDDIQLLRALREVDVDVPVILM